jgi:hypothetical protein
MRSRDFPGSGKSLRLRIAWLPDGQPGKEASETT